MLEYSRQMQLRNIAIAQQEAVRQRHGAAGFTPGEVINLED